MFMDLPGMEISQPDDNYGNVLNSYFTEPEDIDSKELYDPYDLKESEWLRKGIVDTIIAVREINDTGALTSGWSWGPITTAGFLRGVETFLMDTVLEPELAHKVMKKSTALVDGVMRIGSEGGDYIWLPDPTASGTVINAQTFDEFCAPYLSKTVKDWKADLKVPVIYHVCGDTIPVMKEIVATGVDVLSLDHAVDIAEARSIVGNDFTLFGNVHPITTLWNGTPADIRRESLECIQKAGLNGRFILSGGCEVTRDTSIENVRAMVDAGKSHKYKG
jgi:MtaA/CmuA family methyltransferase